MAVGRRLGCVQYLLERCREELRAGEEIGVPRVAADTSVPAQRGPPIAVHSHSGAPATVLARHSNRRPGRSYASGGLRAAGVWARRHLGAQWSGQVAVKVVPHLVRSGPYRVLRHPIYTAWLGMYAGPAIVSGQLHAFLAVALVAFAYGRKILIEEAALHQAFGQTYASYRRDTWALIPWLF